MCFFYIIGCVTGVINSIELYLFTDAMSIVTSDLSKVFALLVIFLWHVITVLLLSSCLSCVIGNFQHIYCGLCEIRKYAFQSSDKIIPSLQHLHNLRLQWPFFVRKRAYGQPDCCHFNTYLGCLGATSSAGPSWWITKSQGLRGNKESAVKSRKICTCSAFVLMCYKINTNK